VRALRCPNCYAQRDALSDYVNAAAWCAECRTHFDEREEVRDVILRLWGRSRAHDPEYRVGDAPAHGSRQLWNRLAELFRLG
jgi:hypothetical protein